MLKLIIMCKCKKCGENYEIPKNSIDMGYMNYCKKCLIEVRNKFAKLPLKEYMSLMANQLGL